jgi:hypothetical protein
MHPDLYSDTMLETHIYLPRTFLDHQIDTLTAQNKEKDFEHFARQMAQRLICPNLRPQTGPTGGGDAKVDSETYPVAPEVTDRWWIGDAAAGSERWAFAFSAKQDWHTKIKADVDSIISTRRGYKRIYFVTNQNFSDKKRSAAENLLTAKAEIPVTILDRNWLLTKVYENDFIGLAISALQLVGNEIPKEKAGPLDAARLDRLTELEPKLADPTAYAGAEYQLAEDALEAALLSRGLERPRFEIEGKFLRAIRLAGQGKYRPQQLRAVYSYVWTAHWWFEDFNLLNYQYEHVESLAINSDSADDLEKLETLWSLLSTLVMRGWMTAVEVKLLERTTRLRAALDALAAYEARPNNALQAKTLLVNMRLADAMRQKDFAAIEAVWGDLANIVDQATHLGSYPLESVYSLIERLGEFAESEQYDLLFEKLVNVIQQRRSEGEAGSMLNRRAIQKMGHQRHYDVIRLCGRAEPLLIKEEYRGELVKALVGGSRAYDRVGLPWASRAKALAAIDTCMAAFKRGGEMPGIIAIAIQSLGWAEIGLGRVGHILAVVALSHLTEPRIAAPAEASKLIREDRENIDRALAVHLMNAPLSSLQRLERLPIVLENMGLNASAFGLVYALGGAEKLIEENFVPAGTSADEIDNLVYKWRTQPVLKKIASTPIITINGRSTLRSVVLGVKLDFDVPDNEESFGVAESVLAAFEAFLATSQEDDILPRTDVFQVEIILEESKGHSLNISFDDNDTSMMARLFHPREIEFKSQADLSDFTNDMQNAISSIMARMFYIRDIEEWISRLDSEERVFDRALILANLLVLNRNVFGHPTGAMMSVWLPEQGPTTPLTRTTLLPNANATEAKSEPKSYSIEQEPPPEGMFDPEKLTHRDRKVLSAIDVQRWNKAGWRGTLIVTAAMPDVPPILGVGFINADIGKKIFEGLRARFGDYDEANDLRVAIIRGINAEEPNSYAVTIGPNFENSDMEDGNIITGLSRINRMTPQSSANLDRFISEYYRKGGFILAPAKMNPKNYAEADYYPDFGIAKKHLVLRNAWDLEEYDFDLIAIDENDTPFVPPGADASRVLKAIERRRASISKGHK